MTNEQIEWLAKKVGWYKASFHAVDTGRELLERYYATDGEDYSVLYENGRLTPAGAWNVVTTMQWTLTHSKDDRHYYVLVGNDEDADPLVNNLDPIQAVTMAVTVAWFGADDNQHALYYRNADEAQT
jgi:hypothetical protein